MADIFIYLLSMSHDLGIDLIEAATKKLEESHSRYPVEKSKGSSKKYTELIKDPHIRMWHSTQRTRFRTLDQACNDRNGHHIDHLQNSCKTMLASTSNPSFHNSMNMSDNF